MNMISIRTKSSQLKASVQSLMEGFVSKKKKTEENKTDFDWEEMTDEQYELVKLGMAGKISSSSLAYLKDDY